MTAPLTVDLEEVLKAGMRALYGVTARVDHAAPLRACDCCGEVWIDGDHWWITTQPEQDGAR